jgi:hypothetical protein
VVQIDDAVFAWNEENSTSNERILVTGSFSDADGIAALERLADRLMCVDDAGVEHTPEARYAGDIVGDDGEMRYTPNYVSTPTPRDGGLAMNVDCKGAIEPPMAQRFRELLHEELAVLGDDVHVADLPWT